MLTSGGLVKSMTQSEVLFNQMLWNARNASECAHG